MAKVIMIQGTASNVGKSLITAGILRVLRQDGFKCAPFKSQNMALNSFVTKDGFEIGRAQAMQAEACGVEPDTRMNPILLKPTSNDGSQIIVNGRSVGNMPAKEYFKYKKNLSGVIKDSFYSLSSEYDIIVIEGAGSPAEINLKNDDIVNMGMAEIADSPVVIVGDIDRGGVFASFYGTVMLLEESERERVKGLIVNKFRGDRKILTPGLIQIEKLLNIPVLGVVPYMKFDIDDEDSLSERLYEKNFNSIVRIVVIRLPRISNYTDFSPFDRIDSVKVIYTSSVRDIENADIIFIPGSKNTVEDLIWMRRNGIEEAIKSAADRGIIVFGICGGFQMMGTKIIDEKNVESGKIINGMGLLDAVTVFEGEKITVQIEGVFYDYEKGISKMEEVSFSGYEIHMGRTKIFGETRPLTKVKRNDVFIDDGGVKKNCFGTYVHGIFDSVKVRKKFIEAIFNKKGVLENDINYFDSNEYKNEQYDLLADVIRSNVDMKAVYDILNRREI